MENMMSIGAKLDKDTADNAASAITSVLKAAFEYRASEDVTLKALSTLASSITVNNVTVTGCTFDNDQSKSVNIEIPKDYEVKV
jgi:hypothetical protein